VCVCVCVCIPLAVPEKLEPPRAGTLSRRLFMGAAQRRCCGADDQIIVDGEVHDCSNEQQGVAAELALDDRGVKPVEEECGGPHVLSTSDIVDIQESEASEAGSMAGTRGVASTSGVIHRAFPDRPKTVLYQDGSTYVGRLVGKERHGEGTWTSAVGTYVGQFKHNVQSGHGKQRWKDGRVYNGQFSAGRFHGAGTMDFPTELGFMVYEGEYFQDTRHGHGKMTWPDGSYHDGDWVKGKRWGDGIHTDAQGRSQKGDWVDDEFQWSSDYCAVKGELEASKKFLEEKLKKIFKANPLTFKMPLQTLDDSCKQSLAACVKALKEHPGVGIMILCSTGKPQGVWKTEELCKDLSLFRAHAVKQALWAQGVPNVITCAGRGGSGKCTCIIEPVDVAQASAQEQKLTCAHLVFRIPPKKSKSACAPTKVQAKEVEVVFQKRPLGFSFNKEAPIKIEVVHKGLHGAEKGVQVGWIIERINDTSFTDSSDFNAVLGAFIEAVKVIPEDPAMKDLAAARARAGEKTK